MIDDQETRKELEEQTKEELIDFLMNSKREIDVWRNWFLEKKFSKKNFGCISEKHKTLLSSYFLYIPSQSFRDPSEEWDNCLAALLTDTSQ